MKTAVFSTKSYDRQSFEDANRQADHELVFFEPRLTYQTSRLADGFPAVCAFVNDQLDARVLLTLAKSGTRLIAPDPLRRFPGAEAADLVKEGAASFHRQLIKGDLASEYDNEIRLWLEELEELK
ncbi:MAG TPA: hypothetical protein VMY42_17450 [Thermoguttaceae bacterium]|nr:hypothetical protein [Thermoguttaceae bacterium]